MMCLGRAAACLVLLTIFSLATTARAENPVVVGRGGFPSLRADASTLPRHDTPANPGEVNAIQNDFIGASFKSAGPIVTVTSSLAIVLALFAAVVWIGRKFGGTKQGSQPVRAEAIAMIGHLNVDQRTKLILVRCGRRVLVLSQSASGLTPVSEITDPEEARELIAHCSPVSRNAFTQTLQEIQRERHPSGFTENVAKPSRKLFASA